MILNDGPFRIRAGVNRNGESWTMITENSILAPGLPVGYLMISAADEVFS